jgi:putative transposase
VGGRYHLDQYPVYLAVILDVFSRKPIGYSRSIDTQLTLAALRMAIVNRNPAPGCIQNSDHGVQYASSDYVTEFKFHGFQISTPEGRPI